MRVVLDAVMLVIGLSLVAIATLGVRWPSANMAEGELRCEGGGLDDPRDVRRLDTSLPHGSGDPESSVLDRLRIGVGERAYDLG